MKIDLSELSPSQFHRIQSEGAKPVVSFEGDAMGTAMDAHGAALSCLMNIGHGWTAQELADLKAEVVELDDCFVIGQPS